MRNPLFRRFAACLIATLAILSNRPAAFAAEPPQPYGPVPNERQLKWHELEFYGFIHFTVNTFTDREWGFGDESPSVFNPTAFDADQIVRACQSGGMKGLILTAKHHDGFCLWPSKYTEHSVKNSPWKEGRGDMVKEFAAACAKHGLKFGIYLSPWDRNHAEYGRPGYVEYYKNQIRELLTQYGPVFEMWFDGASGGDGYYGGQGGTRNIDYNTYYDWKGVRALIRELQPDCAIWCGQYREGDRLVWADCVWGGSEGGDVGDPCWHTRDSNQVNVGIPEYQHGQRDGDVWCPAEGDVSIRPGWFYHASQDHQVKSPEQLMAIYLSCVGRGANLILNVPPDRRGQVHANDVKSLHEFGRLLAETLGHDLARTANPIASNVRGQDPTFGPGNLLDARRETYWATDDDVTTPEVVLEFAEPVTFHLVRLREYLPLGQRIDDWALDVWQDDQWREFAKSSAIGACRLVRSTSRTTTKIRLRITKAAACPALAEFSLFAEPVRLGAKDSP
jgi:alpha-L-fucosidase